MELLIAIDHLDGLVRSAPGLAMGRDARLEREQLQAAIAEVRRAIDTEFGLMTAGDVTASALKRATQELEELARAAPPVMLLGGVRIRRDRARGLVDELRDALPADRASLDAIGSVVARAKPVPLTTQVRVTKSPVTDRLDELRRLVDGR